MRFRLLARYKHGRVQLQRCYDFTQHVAKSEQPCFSYRWASSSDDETNRKQLLNHCSNVITSSDVNRGRIDFTHFRTVSSRYAGVNRRFHLTYISAAAKPCQRQGRCGTLVLQGRETTNPKQCNFHGKLRTWRLNGIRILSFEACVQMQHPATNEQLLRRGMDQVCSRSAISAQAQKLQRLVDP